MSDLESLVTSFARLYVDLMRTFDRRMAEEGASLARTKLLIVLEREGPMRGTAIAERFSHSPRTVTEAIDGLERDGLIRRRPDPEDRRAKLVEITVKGKAAVKRTEPLRKHMIEQTFGVLEPAERSVFDQSIAKISAALHDLPTKR